MISSKVLQTNEKIFEKDFWGNLYGPLVYYIATLVSVLPIFLIFFLLYSILFFFSVWLNNGEGYNFIKFSLLLTFGVFLGGFAMGSLDSKYRALFSATLYLVGGFLIWIEDLPSFFYYYSYLSPIRFGFQGGLTIEF